MDQTSPSQTDSTPRMEETAPTPESQGTPRLSSKPVGSQPEAPSGAPIAVVEQPEPAPPGAISVTPVALPTSDPASSPDAPTVQMERPAPPASPPERHIVYDEREPKQRNSFWEGFKWPLRKLLLGIYLAVTAARRHRAVALTVLGIVLALGIATAVVYQVTRPAPPPVAIDHVDMPPLPASVLHYLHGQQSFNAKEIWDAYNAQGQSQLQVTEPQLQTALNQEKAAGLHVTRYVYTGGYQAPDGTSHYTVEVYASEQSQSGVFTWYFVVGKDGLLLARLDLTQQAAQ